jgi:SAM-dependent methyltransferase
MKLAGYRLILARDTFVHHLDGGGSVWKNRRVMLDRGENDFFNKFGYFPTDVNYSFPFHILSGAEHFVSRKILLLDCYRGNAADEIIHFQRVLGLNSLEIYAADTQERLKMDNTSKDMKYERIDSWYDIGQVFGSETFDMIIFGDAIQTIRNAKKFLEKAKQKLSHNGQLVCAWRNPVNIQILRYFLLSGRRSQRDACRLIKKSLGFVDELLKMVAGAGLFVESTLQACNKEDFYIYGVNLRGIAERFGVSQEETIPFMNKLKRMHSVVSIRKWEPIDDEGIKRTLRVEN